MTRRITLTFVGAVAVMALAAPTAMARYVEGVDLQSAPVATQMTDASNRSKLDVSVPAVPLDALDRSVVANQGNLGVASPYVDAHQRGVGFRGDEKTSITIAGSPGEFASPDAIERAAAAQSGTGTGVIGDTHDRMNPGNTPVSISPVSSGRDIEWPQVGIGFGVGILLALGLWLTVRLTNVRPLAH